jgi:hypothetical protein
VGEGSFICVDWLSACTQQKKKQAYILFIEKQDVVWVGVRWREIGDCGIMRFVPERERGRQM